MQHVWGGGTCIWCSRKYQEKSTFFLSFIGWILEIGRSLAPYRVCTHLLVKSRSSSLYNQQQAPALLCLGGFCVFFGYRVGRGEVAVWEAVFLEVSLAVLLVFLLGHEDVGRGVGGTSGGELPRAVPGVQVGVGRQSDLRRKKCWGQFSKRNTDRKTKSICSSSRVDLQFTRPNVLQFQKYISLVLLAQIWKLPDRTLSHAMLPVKTRQTA